MSADPLLEHVESTVGRIDSGWRASESESGISVARIRDQPYDGVSTYVTLGLNRHVLRMNAREVRQEFIVTADDHVDGRPIASFLQTFAEFVAGKRRALLRGEVVGPSDPVVPGSEMKAIYAALPVLHSDALRTFDGTSPPTVFVWIVPIHSDEAECVRRHGWDAFEDRLVEADPDLCDFARSSVVGSSAST